VKRDDQLRNALRNLKGVKPSEDFPARLERALKQVDRQDRAENPWRRFWYALRSRMVLTLPALASVSVAVHFLIADPTFDAHRVSEHILETSENGVGQLDLALWLDHHAGEAAKVRVHVPHGITLTPSAGSVSSPPECHYAGCTYEFVHSSESEGPHMQVQISGPGRYKMQVEHASDRALVREVFVLHARPDQNGGDARTE